MSQIKKALERARAERLSHSPAEAPPEEEQEEEEVVVVVVDAPEEEAVKYTRTSIVEIPEDELLEHRIVAMKENDPAADQFKLLRTQIFQLTRAKNWNTIMVTGFGHGDGKSMVAANLAISIAKDTRQTTLLADLDFRNPRIQQLMGLGDEVDGLKSYFLDGTPLPKLFLNPGIKKLTVLTAGGKVPNATELLGSPKMEGLIRELKQRYDDRYIILDTPSTNVYPDALVISEYVDAILLVARMDRTTKASIRNALDRLPKEKILGIVVNDVSTDEMSY